MRITSERVSKKLVKRGQLVGEPFARFSFGKGCGSGTCNCSPGYWITLSDGQRIIRAEFSKEEVAAGLADGRLDLRSPVESSS
jgi:hypothetical protein